MNRNGVKMSVRIEGLDELKENLRKIQEMAAEMTTLLEDIKSTTISR